MSEAATWLEFLNKKSKGKIHRIILKFLLPITTLLDTNRNHRQITFTSICTKSPNMLPKLSHTIPLSLQQRSPTISQTSSVFSSGDRFQGSQLEQKVGDRSVCRRANVESKDKKQRTERKQVRNRQNEDKASFILGKLLEHKAHDFKFRMSRSV